jgi:hypothetical protein
MTVRQMHNRLDRLEPLLADSGEPYDPTLAARWNNATGARCHELGNKAEPLTDAERVELDHLQACQLAWTRKHWPWHGEGLGALAFQNHVDRNAQRPLKFARRPREST